MKYQTDKKHVLGLGSAKTGAKHWLGERLKGLILIPLSIAFIWIVLPLVGADYDRVIERIGQPFNAMILMLFFFVGFKHLEEGLQVVIEDYISSKSMALFLIISNKLFCWGIGVIAVFSVAKIAY